MHTPVPSLRDAISGDPIVTRREREVLYEWPDVLSVVVLADETIGQFGGARFWSREEVEREFTRRFLIEGKVTPTCSVWSPS